jgi:hypothetical protein
LTRRRLTTRSLQVMRRTNREVEFIILTLVYPPDFRCTKRSCGQRAATKRLDKKLEPEESIV